MVATLSLPLLSEIGAYPRRPGRTGPRVGRAARRPLKHRTAMLPLAALVAIRPSTAFGPEEEGI